MNESRRELVDRLLAFMGELKDTNARTVAEQLLNHVLLKIWLKHPFRSFLMPDPYTFSTAAGTRSYILPSYFGRVASRDGRIRNHTTGDLVTPREGGEFYLDHPDAGTTIDTATGDPTEYLIAGVAGVLKQVPAAGVALEAISDNANDTDVHVVVEGLDANGVYTASDFTLNGTVAVAVGTWTKVQNFSKSWPQSVDAPTSAQALANASAYTSSRGNVTLRSAVDHVTVYQKLLPLESLREHSTLTLWRTPQAVQTIGIPVLRLPRRLVNDADPVPTLWGPALFEECRKQWLINTGELPVIQGESATPALVDLVCWDNELRSGGSSWSTPFSGM